MRFTSTWFRDTFERAVATYVEAALGVWILAGPADVFNLSVAEGAAASGVIAGLAVVKGALAGYIGKNGASLDPEIKAVVVPDPNAGV